MMKTKIMKIKIQKEEKPDNKTEDEKEDKTEDGDEPEGSNA